MAQCPPWLTHPLRYGIVGTGMMGVEHIHDLMHIDDAQIVALADPTQSSLDAGLAAVGHAVDTYADHRQLLARDDLDAVVIVSPNHTHATILADALAPIWRSWSRSRCAPPWPTASTSSGAPTIGPR